MATKKQPSSKRERAAAHKKADRRNRILAIAGGLLASATLIGVIVATFTGTSDSPTGVTDRVHRR